MKYNTSTLTEENKITPWLAAEGLLSYSPFSPPTSDYFFLYNYILPDIFSNSVNLREHYWFGNYLKSKDCFSVRILRDFWSNARNGKVFPIFIQDNANIKDLEAPIAVFKHSVKRYGPHYLFMQHGSYLKISVKQQPLLEETGYVLLYRGIGKSNKFNIARMPEDKHLIDQYSAVQLNYFSDSVRSFNIAHAKILRCETSHLKSDIPLLSEQVQDKQTLSQLSMLLRKTDQCYTLNKNIAKHKFGPSYVTFKTPASNIRICTFFAGEEEVRILSSDKLIPIKATRCKFDKE